MKKKILFIYDHKPNTPWKDGLWAALNLLEKDYEITKLNIGEDHNDWDQHAFDLILGWGAFSSKVDKILLALEKDVKKALCIAGTATSPDATAFDYDLLFYETEWQKEYELKGFTNTVQAFGINTDIFHPDTESIKLWDYIGVGSLSTWKRWERLQTKPGVKLVIGHYQDENEAESGEYTRWLVANDVMVSNEVEPELLATLYRCSKICYMPSNIYGGGERTLLEAMACGIGVEVESDNPKLQSLMALPVADHHQYYESLKKGIEGVLK